jgi:hypothetical protein
MEKTLEIRLAEQREAIAQEIEEASYVWLNSEASVITIRKIINQIAEIVREKND